MKKLKGKYMRELLPDGTQKSIYNLFPEAVMIDLFDFELDKSKLLRLGKVVAEIEPAQNEFFLAWKDAAAQSLFSQIAEDLFNISPDPVTDFVLLIQKLNDMRDSFSFFKSQGFELQVLIRRKIQVQPTAGNYITVRFDEERMVGVTAVDCLTESLETEQADEFIIFDGKQFFYQQIDAEKVISEKANAKK